MLSNDDKRSNFRAESEKRSKVRERIADMKRKIQTKFTYNIHEGSTLGWDGQRFRNMQEINDGMVLLEINLATEKWPAWADDAMETIYKENYVIIKEKAAGNTNITCGEVGMDDWPANQRLDDAMRLIGIQAKFNTSNVTILAIKGAVVMQIHQKKVKNNILNIHTFLECAPPNETIRVFHIPLHIEKLVVNQWGNLLDKDEREIAMNKMLLIEKEDVRLECVDLKYDPIRNESAYMNLDKIGILLYLVSFAC